MKKSFFLYFLIPLSCLLVPISRARAQDVSIVVSPPRFEVSGEPGEVVTKAIKITNSNPDKELILRAFVVDFIVQDDLGTPLKIESSKAGRYIASPWFTLERSELVIPPATTDQINVIVNIPQDALPGGHYAGVFFEPIASRGLKTTLSYTSTQVGSLFGITVPGDIKYGALIKDFSTPSKVAEFGPINFAATIENQSDTHIRPEASVEIHDMLGRKLAGVALSQANIFPYTSRTLTGIWDQVWGLGRYSATLTATYGPGLTESRTLYFWIMPYRLILTVVVVLLVALALMIVIRRHLSSRDDHRDEEIDDLKRKIAEMENRNH